MLAVMLVAAQKGFWKVDEGAIQELSQQFANFIIQHGLPGSGHTRPDHPLFAWIADRLDADQQQKLDEVMDRARIHDAVVEPPVTTIAELEIEPIAQTQEALQETARENSIDGVVSHLWMLGVLVALLLILGIRTGSRKPVRISHV